MFNIIIRAALMRSFYVAISNRSTLNKFWWFADTATWSFLSDLTFDRNISELLLLSFIWFALISLAIVVLMFFLARPYHSHFLGCDEDCRLTKHFEYSFSKIKSTNKLYGLIIYLNGAKCCQCISYIRELLFAGFWSRSFFWNNL